MLTQVISRTVNFDPAENTKKIYVMNFAPVPILQTHWG